MLRALISLLVLLFHHSVDSQEPAAPTINESFNDAWFNPQTAGQGFFVSVFPNSGTLFLAWFTYDTARPATGTPAVLGEPGHRWLTAFGSIDGNAAELFIELTQGGVFASALPAVSQESGGSITLSFDTCTSGTIDYDLPALGLSGIIPIQRVSNSNVPFCQSLLPQQCVDVGSDPSHGNDNPPLMNGFIIPVEEVVDGGPGPDGIPAIESPVFTTDIALTNIDSSDLVIGVKINDETRAYTHNVMWWHEIVNDRFMDENGPGFVVISHCPLTGTSMLWDALPQAENKTFGVSGLLYNSNLILYDRETGSFWSQMLEQSISGANVGNIPERRQVVETTWGTWLAMYPDTSLITEDTGYTRNYQRYPYGSYRESDSVFFPANNQDDNRLHPKERVVGINIGSHSKVYPITGFQSNVEVLNDRVNGVPVVVIGSREHNFGVIYKRLFPNCVELEFEAVQNRLPVVMRDNEGNEWDVFGTAVSGPRAGQQLPKTNSYISFWFAWTAFFENVQIHQ